MTIPLRWRLVALYTVIVALVIAGFGAVLAWSLRTELTRALDAEIAARAQSIAAVAEEERGQWRLDPEAGLDASYGPESDSYYRIAAKDGTLLLASHNPPPSLNRTVGDGAPPTTVDHAGRHFREATLRVVKRCDDDEPARTDVTIDVTCGKDLADVDRAVATLVRELTLVGPLILLLSIAGGMLIAGRALRPIGRMARQASEISATNLAGRIDARGGDELAHLARTLNGTFERLQLAFDSQARFTADASHELRTPLAAILGNVEIALRRPRDATDLTQTVREIGADAARLQAMVEGLLSLARADARSLVSQRIETDLAALARDAVHRLAGQAAARFVTIDTRGLEAVAVSPDPARIAEVITNLVSNAIRHSPPHATVFVRSSPQPNGACIAVEDHGTGIAPEHQERIFDRFYRVDEARDLDAGGVGLGLAIARSIVEAHGGTISVTSVVGRGSLFTVFLPR